MKNAFFEEAFSEVRLSGEARERILEAAEGYDRGFRTSRPLKIALAAVLTVCVLSGTALAVSPELRDLLWGGFDPVVQRFEPDGENTQVRDGIEARLTSAMTDGFLLKVHVEFRDTTGAGRVGRPKKMLHLNGRDLIPGIYTYMELQGPSGVVGDTFEDDMRTLEPPRFLDFDESTGVLTVELTIRAFNPPEGADRVYVSIPASFMEAMTGRPQTQETPSWALTAAIEQLPTRRAQAGGLEVVLSDIGLVIRGGGEDAGTAYGGAVALTFSDGSASDPGLLAEEQTGGVNGWAVRAIDFAAPIDAAAVTSVTVGDRTLMFR